jgi:hypothetical protein
VRLSYQELVENKSVAFLLSVHSVLVLKHLLTKVLTFKRAGETESIKRDSLTSWWQINRTYVQREIENKSNIL